MYSAYMQAEPRTSHRRRFHRDLIVQKRRDYYRRLATSWELGQGVVPDGRLEKEQAYLGCRRPRCGLCHPHKRWGRGADRARSTHEWQRLEAAAW